MENKKILSVKDLSKYFTKNGKIYKVLDELTFDIYEGDFFGVIGESGSGKSTTGKCVIRLLNTNGGIITFMDKIINNKKISKSTKTWLTKNMQMIFQDPMSSLNPRKNVMSLISEPIVINKTLKKEAKEIINICKKINPFFGHIAKWQDYNLNQKYLLPYYDNLYNSYNNLINKLESFNVENYTSIEVIQDELTSFFLNLENELTKNLNNLNNLVKETKQNIFNNYETYLKKQLDETEIDFIDAKNQYLDEKKKYKKSEQWIELKKERDKLYEQKQELERLLEIKFKEQNSVFISSLITDYNNQAALYHQRRKTTIDLFDYSLNKIKSAIAKDVAKIMEKIKFDIYLSLDDIREFSDAINNHVSTKYQWLLEKITKLSNENEQINESLKERINPQSKSLELTPEISYYYDKYKKIDELIDQKIDEDFLLTSKTIKKIVHDFTKKSNDNKQKIIKEIKQKNDEISKLDIKLEKISIIYKHSNLKDDGAQSLNNQKENLRNRDILRKDFINLDNHYFEHEIEPKIIEQNQEIKSHTLQYNDLTKKVIKSQKEILFFIKKHFAEIDPDFKIAFANLKTEFKNRLNNLDACKIQHENIIEQLQLYKSLRSKNIFVLNANKKYLQNALKTEKVFQALNDVGLKNEHAFRYPHEFSGGQRQRIVIARSLISKPKFIIADEPISALDVSIQAQVVNIMKNLSKTQGITFMFIAHDLSMVNFLCNRLIILHKGKIVEKGDTNEIFNNPIHPYTISLIKASPELSKIHVDLSSFDSDLNYDKNYSIHNKPEFHKVPNDKDHYVFCSGSQFKKWVK